jgi:hypothetical protein
LKRGTESVRGTQGAVSIYAIIYFFSLRKAVERIKELKRQNRKQEKGEKMGKEEGEKDRGTGGDGKIRAKRG